MPYVNPPPQQHVIVSISPDLHEAIKKAAAADARGLSKRQWLEETLRLFLRQPTRLKPVTAMPNRVRLGFNIDEKLHERLAAFAESEGVTMSSVVYTALTHALPE